ncbi:glycosyl hydrolase family 18 protein [Reinekea blandensis]|uniref:Chitinase n=1 Tax=Reinekea blandensis MED297 TaxID=314283 RepID=A4BB99_9GAMM|nr:glycosyl hydrolase family 18 protein [Reinekea blandensis]EAR10712.1 Chitinase [Reinekea sp. MED297] [Reinekea blandensis MED297]
MKQPLLMTALASAVLSTGAFAVDCAPLTPWEPTVAYLGKDQVKHLDSAYEAKWWSRGSAPDQHSGTDQEWRLLGQCDGTIDPIPPTVSLTSPAAGTYDAGTQLTLSANAADNDGSITSVVFLVDGSVIATRNSAPYTADWTVTTGSHTLTVEATDNDNQISTASVNVSGRDVTDPNVVPSVSLTAPADNAEVSVGDVLALTASAADADGSVSSVEFFVDGTSIAIDTTAPFASQWTATVGNHSLSAIATDDDGANSPVDSVSVTVTGDTTPPVSDCRPQGLYQTTGIDVPYCSIYDENGREQLGDHHNRRIIGYFTSWRNGTNGQAQYLASDIPWEKLTHINYAFAHIDDQYRLSVGDPTNPENPATQMTWPNEPGAEMDPSLPYNGHFNLLNKYKQQYPHVKTLISVGGWAETGGFFDDTGERINNGGFYTMTTNPDGSVNTQGINTFADSAVDFIRTYGFDGVDIDYEYPTSMNGAGNPKDYWVADNLRGDLWASYQVLMKTLREKLDAASAEDGQHYLLTIASPSSAYLLRGMEDFDVTPYLDYVNIMSYDLHGAWNAYVGHNAALYDTGEDLELEEGDIYGTAQYGNIGYLNTDWAVHYFRGALPAGRVNIGVPYYTRGWENVSGGNNGLWGKAALPNQTDCPDGTGLTVPCGFGAFGINNLWHDKDDNGNELGAGSNPLWHAKNLEEGIVGSYVTQYGFPANTTLSGDYVRHYDSVAQAPWLWNATGGVFLSTEDEQSMTAKVNYVIDQGVGGIMFWELAGDYDWNASEGEYYIGDTLTSIAYNAFANASPYDIVTADNIPAPTEVLELNYDFDGFKTGDNNFPINPTLRLTNTGDQEIPGGTVIEFNMSTATSSIINDQSGVGLSVISDGSNTAGNNVGGLENTFHRVAMTLPAWQTLAPGEEVEVTMNYYLPVSLPSGFRVVIGSNSYGVTQEYANLPIADLSTDGNDGGDNGDGGNDGSCDATNVPVYPNWPQTDWQGNPSHASGSDLMVHNNAIWEAKWYTSTEPGSDSSWALVCNL